VTYDDEASSAPWPLTGSQMSFAFWRRSRLPPNNPPMSRRKFIASDIAVKRACLTQFMVSDLSIVHRHGGLALPAFERIEVCKFSMTAQCSNKGRKQHVLFVGKTGFEMIEHRLHSPLMYGLFA